MGEDDIYIVVFERGNMSYNFVLYSKDFRPKTYIAIAS